MNEGENRMRSIERIPISTVYIGSASAHTAHSHKRVARQSRGEPNIGLDNQDPILCVLNPTDRFAFQPFPGFQYWTSVGVDVADVAACGG